MRTFEDKFLDVMHKFPLGHHGDNLIVGRWFEDKDLVESVKELYKLKNEIIDNRNEIIRRTQEHEG